MRGGDRRQLERLDQAHRIENVLAEGPHDVRVVVLEGEAEVAHAVVEQARTAEVAAEHVAGEQHTLFDHVGALGVGPVQVGRVQEVQGAAAEVHLVAGGHRRVVGRAAAAGLEQGLEHHLRAARQVHPRLRRAAQQLGQRPAMVRLEVVEHDGGDLVVAGHRFEPAEEVVREVLLDGVDHRHTFAAPDHIGVVGGAVGGPEDDVETAQMRIEGAHPVDTRCDRNGFFRQSRCTHGCLPVDLRPVRHSGRGLRGHARRPRGRRRAARPCQARSRPPPRRCRSRPCAPRRLP